MTGGRIRALASGAPRLVRGLAWRQLVAGSVGIAVVLTISTMVLLRLTDTRPVDVVDGYLSALRQRDPERALRIAGATRPDGGQTAFLTSQALMPGWDFVITDVSESSGTASVGFQLLDAGQQPAAQPDARAAAADQEGIFILTKSSGRWKIHNPFIHLALRPSPLRYLQIGGVRQDWVTDKPPAYLVFPGLYTPYAGHSGHVTFTLTRVFALPYPGLSDPDHLDEPPLPDELGYAAGLGFVSSTATYQPQVRLTKQGEAMVQQAVDKALDGCIADKACELYPGFKGFRTPDGNLSNADVLSTTATVVRYPVISVIPQRRADENNSFETPAAVPGELHLTVTGRSSGGRQFSFATTCLVGEDGDGHGWLTAAVGFDAPITQWRKQTALEAHADRYIVVDCYG